MLKNVAVESAFTAKSNYNLFLGCFENQLTIKYVVLVVENCRVFSIMVADTEGSSNES